jgi:hypothetical protein
VICTQVALSHRIERQRNDDDDDDDYCYYDDEFSSLMKRERDEGLLWCSFFHSFKVNEMRIFCGCGGQVWAGGGREKFAL